MSEASASFVSQRIPQTAANVKRIEQTHANPEDFVILPALGESTVRDRVHALPSVQDDWRAWLPGDKAQVFSAYAEQLESLYTMFSVALNEAMELRRIGSLAKSYQAVGVTPALCARLAARLGALLRALAEHAKHYGTVPNAAPLDPANFKGSKEQRTARMSDLLSRVLLTQRSQFLHKIGTLEEMVGDLGKDFREAADDLGNGTSTQPNSDWQEVDAPHYDINTCLREGIVLLKSFLLVLPEDQLGCFQKTVRTQMQAPEPEIASRDHLRRRMASIGGQ